MDTDNSQQHALPDVAEKYINRIIKKMRYRRKVRREVRQELTDHFVDALQGCRDQTDRQELANQLIESFGDAKLLAKLIRRGKKRCRPLWIKAIIRSCQAIGVSIVLLTVYSFMFFTANATISIDYLARWNEMARPTVDEAENAWPYYKKAANLYIKPIPSIAEVINSNGADTLERFFQLTADEKSTIHAWIDNHNSAYQSLTDPQRQAIEQCLAYNVVCNLTTPTRLSKPLYYPFNTYVSYLKSSILAPQSNPYRPNGYDQPRNVELEDLPNDIFTKWIREKTIPDQFETAVDVAVLREWIDRTQNEETVVFDDFSESQFKMFTNWLKQNKPAWQQFVAGSEKKYCWRKYSYGENNTDPQEQWLIYILLPHLGEIRAVAKMGIWQSKLAEHQGNLDLAMSTCLTVVRAGHHFQQQKSTLIEQLVGISISALAHQQIIRLASNPKLSSNDLARVQHELESIYGPDYPLMDTSGERLMFLDTLQHCFTDGGIGGGHIIPRNVANLAYDNYIPKEDLARTLLYGSGFMLHARRDETKAKAMELYDYMNDGMKMTPYQKKAQNIDFDKQLSKLSYIRYGLINIMMPALDRAGALAFRGKAEHQATLTVLALQRWKKENGSFPDTLDPLVQKGLIKELPDDPYADGPLTYRKRNQDFTLYSVGEDFDDDGGVQSPDNPWGDTSRRNKYDTRYQGGDRVFWPVEK